MNEHTNNLPDCPECGYPLDDSEGLLVCYHCGWFDGMAGEEEEGE